MSLKKRYNEIFDDLRLSKEKMYDIEKNVLNLNIGRRKISIKKYMVVIASLVIVLSLGIITNAATEGELLGKIVNIIGFKIDGNVIEKKDYDKYLDNEGNIEYDKLPESVGDGGLIYTEKDEKGNVISYTVISADDPRNAAGWYWDITGEERYLRVPEKAELKCELELVYRNGKRYANMSSTVGKLTKVIPFSYDGVEFTMVLKGTYDPIPIGAIYKGIVEYDPQELYEGYEMINLKKEVDKK